MSGALPEALDGLMENIRELRKEIEELTEGGSRIGATIQVYHVDKNGVVPLLPDEVPELALGEPHSLFVDYDSAVALAKENGQLKGSLFEERTAREIPDAKRKNLPKTPERYLRDRAARTRSYNMGPSYYLPDRLIELAEEVEGLRAELAEAQDRFGYKKLEILLGERSKCHEIVAGYLHRWSDDPRDEVVVAELTAILEAIDARGQVMSTELPKPAQSARVGKAVECPICLMPKQPMGRSLPAAAANGYCTPHACKSYWDDPQPDTLFPGESAEVES